MHTVCFTHGLLIVPLGGQGPLVRPAPLPDFLGNVGFRRLCPFLKPSYRRLLLYFNYDTHRSPKSEVGLLSPVFFCREVSRSKAHWQGVLLCHRLRSTLNPKPEKTGGFIPGGGGVSRPLDREMLHAGVCSSWINFGELLGHSMLSTVTCGASFQEWFGSLQLDIRRGNLAFCFQVTWSQDSQEACVLDMSASVASSIQSPPRLANHKVRKTLSCQSPCCQALNSKPTSNQSEKPPSPTSCCLERCQCISSASCAHFTLGAALIAEDKKS